MVIVEAEETPKFEFPSIFCEFRPLYFLQREKQKLKHPLQTPSSFTIKT